MRRFLFIVMGLALGGCVSTGPVQNQAKNLSPMKFPCLSSSLSCGELAVREPQKKSLDGALNGDRARGKEVAFTKTRGNCLACHNMAGGTQPGSRGPDLRKYAELGRSDAETYAMVYDMRWRNPGTVMPPMGTNEILSDQEIRDVVAFLQSSK